MIGIIRFDFFLVTSQHMQNLDYTNLHQAERSNPKEGIDPTLQDKSKGERL
jgi:hypothetical protein